MGSVIRAKQLKYAASFARVGAAATLLPVAISGYGGAHYPSIRSLHLFARAIEHKATAPTPLGTTGLGRRLLESSCVLVRAAAAKHALRLERAHGLDPPPMGSPPFQKGCARSTALARALRSAAGTHTARARRAALLCRVLFGHEGAGDAEGVGGNGSGDGQSTDEDQAEDDDDDDYAERNDEDHDGEGFDDLPVSAHSGPGDDDESSLRPSSTTTSRHRRRRKRPRPPRTRPTGADLSRLTWGPTVTSAGAVAGAPERSPSAAPPSEPGPTQDIGGLDAPLGDRNLPLDNSGRARTLSGDSNPISPQDPCSGFISAQTALGTNAQTFGSSLPLPQGRPAQAQGVFNLIPHTPNGPLSTRPPLATSVERPQGYPAMQTLGEAPTAGLGPDGLEAQRSTETVRSPVTPDRGRRSGQRNAGGGDPVGDPER